MPGMVLSQSFVGACICRGPADGLIRHIARPLLIAVTVAIAIVTVGTAGCYRPRPLSHSHYTARDASALSNREAVHYSRQAVVDYLGEVSYLKCSPQGDSGECFARNHRQSNSGYVVWSALTQQEPSLFVVRIYKREGTIYCKVYAYR